MNEQKAKSKKKVLFQAATLCKKKDGKGYYIKVNKDFTVKKDMFISVETPKESIERLAEKGFINEQEAEERVSKVPEFVKFYLHVSED